MTLPGKQDDGFTLLEVLLAIFIFSVVITAVYGSYRTTFTTISTAEAEVELAEQARIILERLNADLESTYCGEGGFLKGQQADLNDARADTLSFTSSAHLVFHRSEQRHGLATLSYSFSQDGQTGLMELYRLDRPVLPGVTETGDQEDAGELLGEGIASFTLRYRDWEGTEEDSWESERDNGQETGKTAQPVMPRLVRIDLRLARSTEDGEGVLYRTAVAIPCARQVQE